MCANPWCSCGKEPQSSQTRDARKETILRNARVSLYFGAAVNSTDFVNATSERTNEWASEPNGRLYPSRARSLRQPIRGQGHARRPIFEMTHRRRGSMLRRERPRNSKVKIQKYKEERERESRGGSGGRRRWDCISAEMQTFCVKRCMNPFPSTVEITWRNLGSISQRGSARDVRRAVSSSTLSPLFREKVSSGRGLIFSAAGSRALCDVTERYYPFPATPALAAAASPRSVAGVVLRLRERKARFRRRGARTFPSRDFPYSLTRINGRIDSELEQRLYLQ